MYKAVGHFIGGITCILNLLKQVNIGAKDAFLVFEWKGKSEEFHTKLNYCSNSKEIGHETTKKSAIILAGCIYFDSVSLEHAHTLP